MQISVNGKNEQAYHIILDKKQAIEILNGKRKAVILPDNYIQQRVFLIEDKYIDFCKNLEIDPDYDGELSDCIKEIPYVHFTEYSDKWHLNVEVNAVSLDSLTEEVMNIYHTEYDLHDLDEYWQQNCKNLNLEDIPQVYCIELGKVVSHSGLK